MMNLWEILVFNYIITKGIIDAFLSFFNLSCDYCYHLQGQNLNKGYYTKIWENMFILL